MSRFFSHLQFLDGMSTNYIIVIVPYCRQSFVWLFVWLFWYVCPCFCSSVCLFPYLTITTLLKTFLLFLRKKSPLWFTSYAFCMLKKFLFNYDLVVFYKGKVCYFLCLMGRKGIYNSYWYIHQTKNVKTRLIFGNDSFFIVFLLLKKTSSGKILYDIILFVLQQK